jgi:exosortase C (VPDSG-CTERM-specific)
MKSKSTDAVATPILTKDVGEGASARNVQPVNTPARIRTFWFLSLGMALAFALPLWQWAQHGLNSQLNSYILIIPFISLYLVWTGRKQPETTAAAGATVTSSPALAVIPLALGLVTLNRWWEASPSMPENDRVALSIFSFICFLWAGALFVLGIRFLKPFLFAAAFLVFMAPLPSIGRHGLEFFFQHTSAHAAAVLFDISGTTYNREGLIFRLPGLFPLEVAEECSGIRSSLILFITSLIAGHMFLKSPYKKLILTVFVIPLAIVRNGFRIFTIAMLCVHVDPSMIDSWIHKRGGPVFFALSLIPFFLLLVWLRRKERVTSPVTAETKQAKTA